MFQLGSPAGEVLLLVTFVTDPGVLVDPIMIDVQILL
nr:hypothetical protein Q903MT_gene2991 [Picea sitchensis]